jgi:hypothetical protein
MSIHEKFERLEKEVAYLFEKFKEEVGLSGGVATMDDSGGGGGGNPPTKPGGN